MAAFVFLSQAIKQHQINCFMIETRRDFNYASNWITIIFDQYRLLNVIQLSHSLSFSACQAQMNYWKQNLWTTPDRITLYFKTTINTVQKPNRCNKCSAAHFWRSTMELASFYEEWYWTLRTNAPLQHYLKNVSCYCYRCRLLCVGAHSPLFFLSDRKIMMRSVHNNCWKVFIFLLLFSVACYWCYSTNCRWNVSLCVSLFQNFD